MDVSNKKIAILGITGAGKSNLANTIFGEDVFKIDHSFNSETRQCQAETRSVNGRSITLIDTPGFFDPDRSEDELKPEIVRCITECAPGPHAFLIVLKVEKFVEQEQAVINKIIQYFSEEVFKYTTVLFTHGDQLTEGQTIEDFVSLNKFLSDLMEKCGGRCFVIDNKYWNKNPKDEYRSNQFQVEELLKSIDKIIEANNGNCYTNDMLHNTRDQRFLVKWVGFAKGAVLEPLLFLVSSCKLAGAYVAQSIIRRVTSFWRADPPQEATRAAEPKKFNDANDVSGRPSQSKLQLRWL